MSDTEAKAVELLRAVSAACSHDALTKAVVEVDAFLTELDKPAVVYRPATIADYAAGRMDVEFSCDEKEWTGPMSIKGHASQSATPWSGGEYVWWPFARVPILPGDEWETPQLPRDYGKVCEFSDDSEMWHDRWMLGQWNRNEQYPWRTVDGRGFKHARIRKAN